MLLGLLSVIVLCASRVREVAYLRDVWCAGYFALNVPSGLALYWFTNNLLSTAQQVYLKSSYKPAFAGPPVIDATVLPPSRKKAEKLKEVTGAGAGSLVQTSTSSGAALQQCGSVVSLDWVAMLTACCQPASAGKDLGARRSQKVEATSGAGICSGVAQRPLLRSANLKDSE